MAPEDYWRQIHGLTIYDLKKENIHDVIVSNYC